MTAQKILDRVEELGILDPKVIAELRKQVRDSKFVVSPEAIVKVLVDKGHLTPYQARKLVADVTAETAAAAETVAVSSPSPPPAVAKPAPTPVKTSIDEDDLIALGDSDSPIQLQPAEPPEEEEIVDLEAALPPAKPEPIKATVKPLTPSPSTPKKPPEKKVEKKPAPPPKPVPPPPVDDDELVELEAVKPAAPIQPPAPKPVPPALKPVITLEPPAPRPAPVPPAPVPTLQPLTPVSPTLQPLAPSPPSLQPLTPTLTPLGSAPIPPPIAGFGSDALLGGAPLDGFGPPKPPMEPVKPKTAKKERGRWDSALMLIGGGGLGILILAFVGLYFALTRGSATEVLDEANKAYAAGSYTQSTDLYTKFAEKFPTDPNVSLARVRISMSKLRQSFEGAKDMRNALKEAQQELPKIEVEESFDDARAELETILPQIADTFAEQAKSSETMARMQDLVANAHEAMKLVNNPSYIPSSRRKEHQTRIDGIMEKIRIAERTINQDQALATALTKLSEAVGANDVAAAYQVRTELLQNYPALGQHGEIIKATRSIAERESKLVRPAPQGQAAATDDPNGPAHARVMLVNRTGDAIPAPANATSYQLLQGAVYAIDVAAGKIRWRRFVGFESKSLPVTLASANGDALLADGRTNELLRLDAATGKVVWRQSIAEPFFLAGAIEDFAIATTVSGRVIRINATTGDWTHTCQLPQKVDVAAGLDTRRKLIYQPSQHSTIHVLSADESMGEPLASRDTYYLGHQAGSLVIPPLVVLGHVFLFDNAGIDYSLVHILARNEENQLRPVREPIRMRGRMTLTPTVAGKRVVLISDLGEVHIVDVEPANATSPINVIATKEGPHSQSTHCYSLLSGTRLWIADTRLAEFELIVTSQKLDPKQSSFDGDTFVAPLQLFDRSLVHVRKRQGANSLTITGKNLAGSESWQIDLAGGIAGISSDMQRREIAAITQDGNLYEISQEHFKQGLRDEPSGRGGSSAKTFRWADTLASGGQLFLERRGKEWLVYDGSQPTRLSRVDSGVPDPISAAPTAFAGGILAPLATGSVWLLDSATGQPLAETGAFQPELAPGAKIGWLQPLRVDDRQFVVIDRERRTVYLARREEKPKPYLAESRALTLDFEPVAANVLGNYLFVVARGEAADEVIAFSLPALEVVEKWPVEGRVGPRGIESSGGTLFCEAGGEVWQLGAKPEIVWKPRVPAPLVAAPIKSGENWLAVTRAGKVLALAGSTGEATELQNAGEPLGGPIHLFGTRLVVGGADGTLHILSAKMETP